jgi:enoyl-CoA hydratase/carnithine racemase
LLTGGRFDTEWAMRYGLVNHVVPAAEVMPKALALAETICANGPLAVRLAKEAAYTGRNLPIEDGLRFEIEQSRKVMASEDAREGPLAFAQKRKPEYKGR